MCQEGVWKVSGRYLEGVWKVFGRCMEGAKKVYESCLVMEDNLLWKTTFNGRQPLMEDIFSWNSLIFGKDI